MVITGDQKGSKERLYIVCTLSVKYLQIVCALLAYIPSTMSVMALIQNMGVLNKLADHAIAAASISFTVAP